MKKDDSTSVVRPWLAKNCTLKMQSVLLSALRGCDGLPKEDISKAITRKFRGTLFFPANKAFDRSYMNPDVSQGELKKFYKNLDPYPVHWLFHFAHACEIVGYFHPDSVEANFWWDVYQGICQGLHVNVETLDQLSERLKDNISYEESIRS